MVPAPQPESLSMISELVIHNGNWIESATAHKTASLQILSFQITILDQDRNARNARWASSLYKAIITLEVHKNVLLGLRRKRKLAKNHKKKSWSYGSNDGFRAFKTKWTRCGLHIGSLACHIDKTMSFANSHREYLVTSRDRHPVLLASCNFSCKQERESESHSGIYLPKIRPVSTQI